MAELKHNLRLLGGVCIIAAIVSGILKGAWEVARPILVDAQVFASAPAPRLWAYALLEVIKSVGFFAGLFGFYQCATKRGPVVKVFMMLAALGAVFFAVVWLAMAATAHFTIIYVLGGIWYQMIAPVVLGIAAISARYVSRWQAITIIAVGIINSQIFPLLGPGRAMIVQGIVWLVLGYLVFKYADNKQLRP